MSWLFPPSLLIRSMIFLFRYYTLKTMPLQFSIKYFFFSPTVKQPLSVSLYRGLQIQSKIHPCLTVLHCCIAALLHPIPMSFYLNGDSCQSFVQAMAKMNSLFYLIIKIWWLYFFNCNCSIWYLIKYFASVPAQFKSVREIL